MNYWLRITLIIAFSLLSWSVQAQSSADFNEEEIDCETAMTTIDLRYCAMIEYEEADKELNEVYQKLIASYNQDLAEAKARGREEGDLDYITEPLKLLRQSQRDWIKFRDSFCNYEASQSWGGTMEPLVYTSCRANMTQEQTKRLRGSQE